MPTLVFCWPMARMILPAWGAGGDVSVVVALAAEKAVVARSVRDLAMKSRRGYLR